MKAGSKKMKRKSQKNSKFQIPNSNHSIQNSTFKIQHSFFCHFPSLHSPLPPCFILTGGKSSRFGSDKSKLFYKHQYKLCKKVFKNVYFVAKSKKFKNYPFFIEKSKTYAPIFALEEIIKKYKKVFVINIDTPFVSPKTLKKLAIKKAVAKQNPLIGYYDYTMLQKLKQNKNTNLKIYNINKNQIKISDFEAVNINRKEELKFHFSDFIRQRRKWNIY